ncbi:aspartate kinase [Actinomycetaceae bacterium TAE3-ERU4]|nr:aspartate kinase [Actinomycetaceae bacterium TAE3-ERU4]
MANAKQFRKIKKIIEADAGRRFIVSSACGKSDREDHKVTDLLYLCHAHEQYGVPCDHLWALLTQKYLGIRDELGLTVDVEGQIARIRAEVSDGASVDYLVSRGEYLTSLCLAEFLDADFIDAAEVISFDYSGQVDMEQTSRLLKARLNPGKRAVIPGFYGSMPGGLIKIMSRGGSDITGSIVANVVDADVYENWTDVPGILVADPRIVDNPPRVERLTYLELRELSYMGANVLHDEAIFPIHEKDIPINIRSTNEPDNPGTMIVRDCSAEDKKNPPHYITGISGRKDFSAITCMRSHMSTEVGVMSQALAIFEKFKVSIEAVPAGVDTFTVIAPSNALEGKIHEIVAELHKLNFDSVRVEDKIAMLAIVGRGMRQRHGISGAFFAELGMAGINIRTISQTVDELDIIIGIDNRDYEEAIRRIYNKFILTEKERHAASS